MTETATAPEAPDTQLMTRRTGAEIGFGITAINWEDAFRMAKVIADSEMIPKGYRGKPADVVVAMQMGAEVGLGPMAALQSIRVINGQPGLYGDGFLAVIMASPRYVRHEEYYVTAQGEVVEHLSVKDLTEDETTAVSKFWRKGIEKPFTGTFSIADAKKANLWKKEGPWQEYPARQMKWRARGWGGRDGFAAELRGMKMVAELEDMPDDIEVREAPRDDPRPRVMPIRRSEKPEPLDIIDDQPAAAPSVPTGASPSVPTRPAGSSPSRQAAGKRAAPPSGSSADPAVQLLESMVITETNYCTPKDDDPYYEIKAQVSKAGSAPLGFVFSTKEKLVYELAQSAEGSEATFNLTWKPRHRKDKSAVKELVAIAAS